MRFHVAGLPHTETSRDYNICAFTNKIRGFCDMMSSLGHEVFLYAGERNDCKVTELITCQTEKDRAQAVGDNHFVNFKFEVDGIHWVRFNNKVIEEMKPRIQPHDFICLIGGKTHKRIADAFPQHMSVEFGIGYGGTFAKYRVWESYAWMHTCYGTTNSNPNALDGIWYDAVIPGYVDYRDCPFSDVKDDYFLFVGRLIDRKGYKIAQDVCQKLGARLIVAGPGDFTGYGEYAGEVSIEKRGELMSKARALFVPTQYIEPFGTVVIEGAMSGTPVISTDWGAFTETVKHGETGFRCRSLQEFVDAASNAHSISPHACHAHAMQYTLEATSFKYQDYFTRLQSLWGDGWYQVN